jgi:hypothetical protein
LVVVENTNGGGGNGENNSKPTVKLPQINIPEFTGKVEEWMEFFDIFKSLIDENKSISPIEKFYYLKSSLRGEALRIISSLEISAANYKGALDLLKNRYDNKNIIIQKHIAELFNLPAVVKENSIQLRGLLDSFNKHF